MISDPIAVLMHRRLPTHCPIEAFQSIDSFSESRFPFTKIPAILQKSAGHAASSAVLGKAYFANCMQDAVTAVLRHDEGLAVWRR